MRLLLAGKLHPVRVPGREEEALRDLVRARESVRMDLMRARHRLSKLLLRHGHRFEDGNAWTDRHRQWLASIDLDWPAAQMTLLDYRGAIDALCLRRDSLEREIIALLPSSPWTVQTGRLRCLRGVDTLTAVGLCAEIGDFERFAKPEQLMSYIGVVPSEASTGQQRRLGSITKTGSAHARRLLTEAAWHYRPRPNLGKALTERQQHQPPAAVAVAWKAQLRLHRTWARLEARNKRRTLIAVAAARELAGFCWAITQIESPHPTIPITSRRLGRWRPGNARGTRDTPMSNPPRLVTLDIRRSALFRWRNDSVSVAILRGLGPEPSSCAGSPERNLASRGGPPGRMPNQSQRSPRRRPRDVRFVFQPRSSSYGGNLEADAGAGRCDAAL